MTLDEWAKLRPPVSKWRRQARAVMLDVVQSIAIMNRTLIADSRAVIERVDAAYPFGERSMQPYRCWLRERRLLIEVLEGDGDKRLPTADEVGVCEVARDLVELGRHEEARALVEQQAPNRLARKCPACGSPAGRECVALAEDARFIALDYPTTIVRSTTAIVAPHHARLVGHLDAGPLFKERG